MIYRNALHSNNKNQMYHIGHTDNIFCPNGETLSIRLESIKSDITNHATRLNTLDRRCTNIESKNSSQDTEINNLKSRMTNAENKNTEQDQRLDALINLLYPVDSIKITYNNKNPGTYLPGTTWQLISSGRYIRGASSSDTGGATGGTSTVNLAHTHSIPAHSHTINHTHTIPAHNHTVNAHSHSTGNHTLTLNEIPAHNHGSKSLIGHVWNIAAQTANQMISANGICSEWTCDDNTSAPTSWANYQGDGFEIDATHTHNTQGGGGAHNHGNTGSASPATNSKTLTTNQGGGTSGSAALTTNSNLSDISIKPLYLALFIWRRTK